jgi:hypothetical protein
MYKSIRNNIKHHAEKDPPALVFLTRSTESKRLAVNPNKHKKKEPRHLRHDSMAFEKKKNKEIHYWYLPLPYQGSINGSPSR